MRSEGLAARGYKVTVLGRDAAAGEALVEKIESYGGDAIFEAVDLLSLQDIKAFSERVRMRDEPLDLLVNNAGGDRFHLRQRHHQPPPLTDGPTTPHSDGTAA